MGKIRAGIYARISSAAEDDRLAIDRQIADCEALAARRGWLVVDRYPDHNISATRAKKRPEYVRMLADIAAGRINGLVVWDVDRLTRTPRELEDVIDLADRHGLQLANCGGEVDLATPQGRLTARMKGTVARHEAEQMSRRIRRKCGEKAEAGTAHGPVAYGYKRVIKFGDDGKVIETKDVIDEEQATVVRDAARRVLVGESLRSICADMNGRGVPTPRAKGVWTTTLLRQVMLRDRNAGLRRHQGKVIGKAVWTPIYDVGTHDRVVAALTDPDRRTNKGATRRHLLTGIARCGRDGCDGTMVVNCGRMTGDGKRQPPAYVCGTCYRVRRKESQVDALVEALMIARLKRPDALAALSKGDPAKVTHAEKLITELTARLEVMADEFADGKLEPEEWRRVTSKLRPQIAVARAVVRANEPSAPLAELTGPDAQARWDAASLDVKRSVIELLCDVTILPSGSGKRFDPDSVRVDWRGSSNASRSI